MKRGLMVLSVIGVMCAGVASAAVQQGDTELEFLGSWLTVNAEGEDASDWDALILFASMGYFLTDNIQVAPAVLAAWTEIENTDYDIFGLGVRAKYHFMPTNQWVPYVGMQLFWGNVDVDSSFDPEDADLDAFLWSPLVGMRYELNAYNDFFVEYQYHLWEDDISDSPDSGGPGFDDGHAIFMGLVHQFK